MTYYNMSWYANYMKNIREMRDSKGISQRAMAALADVSFRTVQLMESGFHDPRVSTLARVATALGYPPEIVEHRIASIFDEPSDSIVMVSERIVCEGEEAWRLWLFEFVDAMRTHRDVRYIATPPARGLSARISALIAATVETLCDELNIPVPSWCGATLPLKEPWFVAGIENLKATSLIESPLHFRKRNIFVLENFLERR